MLPENSSFFEFSALCVFFFHLVVSLAQCKMMHVWQEPRISEAGMESGGPIDANALDFSS